MYDITPNLITSLREKGYACRFDTNFRCWRVNKDEREYRVTTGRKSLEVTKSGTVLYNASLPENDSEIDVFIKLVL